MSSAPLRLGKFDMVLLAMATLTSLYTAFAPVPQHIAELRTHWQFWLYCAVVWASVLWLVLPVRKTCLQCFLVGALIVVAGCAAMFFYGPALASCMIFVGLATGSVRQKLTTQEHTSRD